MTFLYVIIATYLQLEYSWGQLLSLPLTPPCRWTDGIFDEWMGGWKGGFVGEWVDGAS